VGNPRDVRVRFLSDSIKTNALLVSRLAYYELPSGQPLFLGFPTPKAAVDGSKKSGEWGRGSVVPCSSVVTMVVGW